LSSISLVLHSSFISLTLLLNSEAPQVHTLCSFDLSIWT
jgi:hypothetical protein